MIILALRDQEKSRRLAALLAAAGHPARCVDGLAWLSASEPSADAMIVMSWPREGFPLCDWVSQSQPIAPRVFALVEPRCGLREAPAAGPKLLLGRTPEEACTSVLLQASRANASDAMVIEQGQFVVNLESMRAWRRGTQLTLSFRQLRALDLFLRHPGVVMSRKDLLMELWAGRPDVTSKAITRFMLSFRRQVCPRRMPNPVLAVKGFGYAFSP